MNVTQLNLACAAFQNVDLCSLHTADPGTTGLNDSGLTKPSLTWSTPSGGQMNANAVFEDVPPGEFTHVGLWDGTTFIKSILYPFTTVDTIDLTIAIVHRAVES